MYDFGFVIYDLQPRKCRVSISLIINIVAVMQSSGPVRAFDSKGVFKKM